MIVAVLAFAAGGVLLVAAAVGVCAFSIALPNPLRVFRNYGTPADFGLDLERLTFGRNTPAWFFPAESDSVVLVCHGRSRGKAFELPLIRRLNERFRVLAPDFPGHGETPYGWTTIGWAEADVVLEAIRWLEGRGEKSVFIYGVSAGGAAVLRALAKECPPCVRGIAVDGVFADLDELLRSAGRRLLVPPWIMSAAIALAGHLAGYDPRRMRPESDIAAIDRPILVLHGDRDPLAAPAYGRRLAEAAPDARWAAYPGTHDEPDNRHMQDSLVAFFEYLQLRSP